MNQFKCFFGSSLEHFAEVAPHERSRLAAADAFDFDGFVFAYHFGKRAAVFALERFSVRLRGLESNRHVVRKILSADRDQPGVHDTAVEKT